MSVWQWVLTWVLWLSVTSVHAANLADAGWRSTLDVDWPVFVLVEAWFVGVGVLVTSLTA